MGDNSFESTWLSLTAQEQENKSSSDDGDDGSDGSRPNELADSSSDDEVMIPMMRALRIKTFTKKRHNKEPKGIPADRSSNCGSLAVADEGSEVAEQDDHSPKRPTMPKCPPG